MSEAESDIELGKPPIVEGWVRASYVPSQDDTQWDWHEAVDFLESFRQELPIRESLPEMVPVASDLKDGELPDVIEIQVQPKYIRVRTDTRSKVVQVGEHAQFVSWVASVARRGCPGIGAG